VVAAGLLPWVRMSIADREHFATTFNTKSLPTYLSVVREVRDDQAPSSYGISLTLPLDLFFTPFSTAEDIQPTGRQLRNRIRPRSHCYGTPHLSRCAISDVTALGQLDARKVILESLVYLAECGYVMPVLNAVGTWSMKVDYSLTRHFVGKARIPHLGSQDQKLKLIQP